MITLFHDYTSPASAVAVARAHRLQADGTAIELIGFEAIGVDIAVPVTLDVLAELDSLTEVAAAESVTLRRPKLLPPTGLAHVVEQALSSDSEDLARAWRTACYGAFWSEGRDISDMDVLRHLGQTTGIEPAWLHARLTDRAALAAVRRTTTDRRRDGVGGVPAILAQRTLVPGLLTDEALQELARL